MLQLKVTYIPPAGPLYITWGEIPPNPKTSGQPGESSDARGAMDIVRVCTLPSGNSTAFNCTRAEDMLGPGVQAGDATDRSMVSVDAAALDVPPRQ
jgi:hypothetical protein